MKGRFRGIERIHFVGIGGIGMCGLAELLQAQGYTVTGSDLAEGATVARLRALGVPVAIGHDSRHVGQADVVVVSSAIRANNPERVEASLRGIPVIPRAEMLAEVMRLKDGIAIAGTHGKTTTTSLVAHVLQAAGLDPTIVVGGRVIGAGAEGNRTGAEGSRTGAGDEGERTGARLGGGPFLVAEADESDGSFLHLSPVIAVVTNVEAEHLDHHGNVEALEDAFAAFLARLPFWGTAVLCLDDPGVQRLLARVSRRRITYGLLAQADWVASEVTTDGPGMAFAVRKQERALGHVRLPLAGRHNVANALAALAVADELAVPFAVAAEALASFRGVERRFETKGVVAGIRVVDDYAHHPTELRATLAAARGLHAGRIVVVFQPHRHTRTRDFFDAFTTAFHDADLLVLTEIYGAGEPKLPGVEAAVLADAIRARGHRDVRFVADLERVVPELLPELESGDLVLTLGAGSVSRLGPRLLQALVETRP
jgi:UDP-N-acetylmuramate--alanine ligase